MRGLPRSYGLHVLRNLSVGATAAMLLRAGHGVEARASQNCIALLSDLVASAFCVDVCVSALKGATIRGT